MSGHRLAFYACSWPDRLVRTMMGGGAFDWLKTGRISTKSAKQAEIRLANLQKILSIVQPQWANRRPVNQPLSLFSGKNG
jgi:hypothetical protein